MDIMETVKAISIIIGVISGAFAVFFAGWNLSKSKNGYVKKSDCLLHHKNLKEDNENFKKEIKERNEEQTKTLILLDRKINQILGYLRAENGQGIG
jgi:hypothetical protein